jgi:ribonuclease E
VTAAAASAPAAEQAVERHENADGSVVLRFPPVAPSPFARERLPGTAPQTPAPPAAREPRRAPAEPPARTPAPLPTSAALEEPEEAPVAVAPVEADEADEADDDREGSASAAVGAPVVESDAEQRMTRSQKRRLRRRRRLEAARLARGGGVPHAGQSQPPAAAAPVAPPTPVPTETPPAEDETPPPTPAAPEPEEEEDIELVEPVEPPPAAEPRGRSGRGRRRRPRRRRDEHTDSHGPEITVLDTLEPTEAATAEAPVTEEPAEAAEAVEVEEVAEEAAPAIGVKREMLINCIPRDECRIAIIENGRLEELYLERASYENHVGSIYKGVVTNVESSIQAAFVDFGLGKNGFLHITDLHPDYFGTPGSVTENVGRKMPRRARPPIQKCLRRGQEVIVQITKEGIGTKGPTLSTYLSIPGRFLVMMPGMRRLGISRKIEDDDMRDILRDLLRDLDLPEGVGFIARTAAASRTHKELQSDLDYLARLWRAVERRIKNDKAPCELYRESDLVIRTIRDVFATDIEHIYVDEEDVAQRAREFLAIFSPKSRDLVQHYADPEPLFHKYGVEAELEKLHVRRVPLASGGSLVIEATEALVAIDVNSGRFRAEDDAESTAFKINIEAADEISRQLRLRDLGGVVVCDFIDMRQESHKREVERRLANHLKRHKERAKILRMSQFGIIEMTRQRQRASLTRSVYHDCDQCHGTGLVKTLESVVIDAIRLVQFAATRTHVHQIELTLGTVAAEQLQNRKRAMISDIEARHHKAITIRADAAFGQDQAQVQCYDQRGRLVPHT